MSYKDFISTTLIHEHRKTWHIELVKPKPCMFKAQCVHHVQNPKRRPCVQKRLSKLARYVRMAWKGYRFGLHPNDTKNSI